MDALVRESNFLMTDLYLKCSDYTLVFDDKLSATSLAVMEEFESIEALAEASSHKPSTQSRASAPFTLQESWLKSVIFISLPAINNWLNSRDWPGRKTSLATLEQVKRA